MTSFIGPRYNVSNIIILSPVAWVMIIKKLKKKLKTQYKKHKEVG